MLELKGTTIYAHGAKPQSITCLKKVYHFLLFFLNGYWHRLMLLLFFIWFTWLSGLMVSLRITTRGRCWKKNIRGNHNKEVMLATVD